MPELEEELTALRAVIEWPATPRFRLPVHGDIVHLPTRGEVAAEGRRLGGPLWQSRWALAAAAVLLIVATLLAYTPAREAIAGWINLHVIVHRVPNLPTPSPLPPGQLGANLDLGSPVTLEQARSQVSWKVMVPSSLGRPDVVYVKQPPSGPSKGEVTLVYSTRPDIPTTRLTGVSVLVTEARGAVEEIFFQKTLGPESKVEEVSVGGHRGFWISGSPHEFAFTDASGSFYRDPLRLATNTLIFDDNGTIVRIEGDMTRAQALQIANSLV